MLRISTHIERVLLVNDCVIIPDFGGFVLQKSPAVYAAEEYAFYPPYKEVVFNPSLNHNDGLLAESYMATYGMDFNEAQAALKNDVHELKTMLEQQNVVSLGAIGTCYKNGEHSLIFEPERDSNYSIHSYGLTMFHMAPIESERKRQEAVMETLHMRKNVVSNQTNTGKQKGYSVFLPLRIAGQVAGVAAAACVLFFLITTPVKDVDGASYKAGFVLPEMLNLPPESTETHEWSGITENPDAKEEILSENAPLLFDSTSSVSGLNSEGSVLQPESTLKSEILIEKAVSGTYYVIIASFDSKRRARQFISEIVSDELRHVGIVENEDKIRVYADKNDNRVEAEAYMLRLRENEKYKTSWLFIGRQEP